MSAWRSGSPYEKPHPHARGVKAVKSARAAAVLTPSAVMGGGVPGAFPPLILPEGSEVSEGQVVSIQNHPNCPHNTIFYTTDGSEPTIHSKVYDEPFMVYPPAQPQMAVRAVSAAAVNRVSTPATEIFRFERANASSTPDPVWDTGHPPRIRIRHAPSATVFFSLLPSDDPLEGGYLYSGPFTLYAPAGKTFDLSAVAVMPGMEPSRRVSTSVVVPPSSGAGGNAATSPAAMPLMSQATSPVAWQPAGGGGGGEGPTPGPRISVQYHDTPPSVSVSPLPGGGAGGGDAAAKHVYYAVDGGGAFKPFPESGQLTIPMGDEDHLYTFVASRDPLPDLTRVDAARRGATYLYVPQRPQFKCSTDVGYILEQAMKWLWEVVSRVQVVHDQWKQLGYAPDKRELTHCASKMESAIIMALFHLKAGSVLYEGKEVVVAEGDVVRARHFSEANDAVMTLYHALLEVQRGATDERLTKMLEQLKAAMYALRLMLELLPSEPPVAGHRAPSWLDAAKARIRATDLGADAAEAPLVQAGLETAALCGDHRGELPAHAEAARDMLEALARRLEAAAAARDRLEAEVHQAGVDADELRNNVDTQLAWINAARLREARLEATIEELRRSGGGGGARVVVEPQVRPVSPSGQHSHLAFLITPD